MFFVFIKVSRMLARNVFFVIVTLLGSTSVFSAEKNGILAQSETESAQTAGIQEGASTEPGAVKTILINFNNVQAVEFIRFISRISGKNFIFDEEELQFQITIVSEEPTTLENIMAALLQELRVHNLSLTEQGNNVIIHKNASVTAISSVVADNLPEEQKPKTEIITRLFRLNSADPSKLAVILRPLMSASAIIEVFKDTNHLIVTDIASNIDEVALLIKSLDAPNNGLVIGQYVVRTGFIDSLIQLTKSIMQPIAQDQTLLFVPHRSVNSIFIVSTPFMMERTMALLQYLDQTQGLTRIFDLKDLKFSPEAATTTTTPTERGQWELDNQGNWVFKPLTQAGVSRATQPPEGSWYVDEQGNWHFRQGVSPTGPGRVGISGPEGQWNLDPQGIWVFQLAPGKSIAPERLARAIVGTADLPLGSIERTQFYIHKLQFRRGDQIAISMARIGQALRTVTGSNLDLIATIDSVQWLEGPNSLIFTGTMETIEKVKELIAEIDTPLRQVWIEMLILDTTLDDSLNYGVDWSTEFGGGGTAGAQSFLAAGSPLPIAMQTAGIGLIPDASALNVNSGFNLGIVGRHLTFCGLRFSSIGALVRAIHSRSVSKVVLTPRILTEDNNPAEIFVGINTQFPTQAIVNDQGSIITQNFEFRDVGTRLRVIPQIGDNDIITLTIEEEQSSVAAISIVTPGTGPTTRKNTTRTRFHLPNEFFLVISGMLQDQDDYFRNQVPCLGGIPFIGAAFSNQTHHDNKRNLLLFIRPRIIDTEYEIDNLTKHQQDVFNYNNYYMPMWQQEPKEALDYFNLPDQCEDLCDDCCAWP